jgi:Mn2+/Fe2+ NRAMP family transporter
MFGSGESFSNSSVAFADQIVALYTRSLGEWAAPIIKISAFTTMFSTTLTVTDAYPRVVRHMAEIMIPKWTRKQGHENLYRYLILILALVAMVIIQFLGRGIKGMIDLATTLSFLTTPVLAWMNYKVITGPTVPDFAKPRIGMRILSWLGLIFWTGFVLVFIYIKLV